MRLVSISVTIVIVLFWGVMNTLLIERQRQMDRQGLYQRGVNRFLATSPRRETWVGVYRKLDGRSRKMGYSGIIHEKVIGVGGTEYHTELDAALETELFGAVAAWLMPLMGTGILRVRGHLTQDAHRIPLRLHLEIELANATRFTVTGRRSPMAPGDLESNERFVITVHGAAVDLPPLALPLVPFELSSPLAPDLPLAGLREGETIEVTTFSPLLLRRQTTTIRVLEVTTKEVGAVLADVYEVELDAQGVRATALVTRDGTLLRMELTPPFKGVVLRAETEHEARMGFRRERRPDRAMRAGQDAIRGPRRDTKPDDEATDE